MLVAAILDITDEHLYNYHEHFGDLNTHIMQDQSKTGKNSVIGKFPEADQ
jgi:hypothetical protein